MNKRTCTLVMVAAAAACGAIAAGAEPVIKVERKPWGADYTLVSSDGPGETTFWYWLLPLEPTGIWFLLFWTVSS